MSQHRFSPLVSAKSTEYFQAERREVLDAIVRQTLPTERVLELGCSSGTTARAIRERCRCSYYVGVERDASSAAQAARLLDKVIVADLDNFDTSLLGSDEHSFDLLICLDVLEHLYDPWRVLKAFCRYLRPDGFGVFSIPNTQNILILSQLVAGQWRYEEEGLLDATHIRFFTKESIQQLLAGAGFEIISNEPIYYPPFESGQLLDIDNRIQLDQLSLVGLSRDQALAFFAFQFVITARKHR